VHLAEASAHKKRQTIDLGAARAASIAEHEYCSDLDTGLENDRVWVTCTCGAELDRALEPVA
jgi:hypothetical protein